jgi:hypothetical protein
MTSPTTNGASPEAEIVSLIDWAEASKTFAWLCDEASAILATPLGRDDPKLPGIASQLTSALEKLGTIEKPYGQTSRALSVLTNVVAHTSRDVIGAIDWFKRLASIGTTSDGSPTRDCVATPRAKPRSRAKHIEGQQSIWGSEVNEHPS